MLTFSKAEKNILSFLYNWNRPIRAGDISKNLTIKHSTLNSILARIEEKDGIIWKKYGLISLTNCGKEYIEHLTKHKHLFSLLLTDTLKMSQEEAHSCVDVELSSNLSCQIIKRIAEKYNEPSSCLCGQKISYESTKVFNGKTIDE